MLRNNHQRCSVRKGVLKNFEKFTGKHLCQSLHFNKIEALRSATLLKKRLWHSCFPVNFPKFLRTPFLQNISGRLLLNAVKLVPVKFQKQQYTPIPNKAKQNSKISYYLLHQHKSVLQHTAILLKCLNNSNKFAPLLLLY